MKRQFLILTDDFNVSQPIQAYFENAQTAEIYCASSLAQAINLVMERVYCLLIIDLQLPSIDRLELIRIFHTVKHIPILALTEPLDADKKIELFRVGVNAFLEKPINADICFAQAEALAELFFSQTMN